MDDLGGDIAMGLRERSMTALIVIDGNFIRYWIKYPKCINWTSPVLIWFVTVRLAE
jgi:hypothetical protein